MPFLWAFDFPFFGVVVDDDAARFGSSFLLFLFDSNFIGRDFDEPEEGAGGPMEAGGFCFEQTDIAVIM